jgi:ribosomal protein L11 methyltransferase
LAWLAANFEIEGQYVDMLTDALMAAGAIFVDMTDAHVTTPLEQIIYAEPGQVSELTWKNNRLSAIFDLNRDVRACLTQAFEAVGLVSLPHYTLVEVSDQDWVAQAQAQFQPIHVSKRIWVVPTWHAPKDANAINLRIDPGLAFGTGSHASTSLCLQWLDTAITGGESVLDYGCGSGILTIAAEKLGAGRAIGVDIDDEALQVSRRNAQANGTHCVFCCPDDLQDEGFDIVIANILANPLKVLAPLLSRFTRPGGVLVVSGLLVNQENDIRAAYRDWIRFEHKVELDGWICLVGRHA